MRRIKENAAHYRKFYNQPWPEADAIIAELRESANEVPKGMTREEEIKYMLEQADRLYEQDEEIKAIFKQTDRICEQESDLH